MSATGENPAWGPAAAATGPRPRPSFDPRQIRRERQWRLFRGVRATVTLVVIALGLGVALAGGVGALVWAISAALHSAATG